STGWRQSRILYHSSLPVIPYYPPRYSDTLGTGTLQHVYNYEVCRTTDSRKSDSFQSAPADIPPTPLPRPTHGDQQSAYQSTSGNTDFDKKRQCQIHVRASDEGGLTDTCKIVVEITDTNDNAPVINVMSKSSALTEDIQPGTVVTMINVQDPDSGENGKVHCYIKESIPFTISSTSSNFFSLTTDSELDRERESEYNITVSCSDEGAPSLSSSVTLTLQISDVNDNAPVFERSSYQAYIVENNSPGLSIFTVRARDADWNQNARVSYILEESSVNGVPVSSYVSVSADIIVHVAVPDPPNHALSVHAGAAAGVVDSDNLTFYLVLALAVVSFLFITCLVVIVSVKIYRWRHSRILYHSSLPVIPYYPPRYSDTLGTGTLQHVYNYEVCRTTDSRKSDFTGQVSYSVPEEMSKGSFIGDIAQDLGLDPKRLKSGKARIYTGDNTEYIELNTEKGILLVKDRVDREAICAQTSPCALHFQVILENPMEFYSIAVEVSYSIPEEMPKGSVLGNIARDLGLDVKRLKSGKARIFTGDSAEYIELNRDRGVLLVKDRIDREMLCKQTTPCALHLQIILENPMELFRITVEITDINDNSPVFKYEEKLFEISESAVPGSKFVLDRAVDADIGVNGLKNYSLKPSDHFQLRMQHHTDGNNKVEMVLHKQLDREKEEEMSLLLTAVDGGEPQMSGTVKIFVTVLDVNDNAPVFVQPVYKAAIAENSQKGTTLTRRSSYQAYIVENNTPGLSIFTVRARDADWNQNARVSYILEESSVNGVPVSSYVSVSADSGVVHAVRSFDYEQIKDFHFLVRAQDGGSPPLSSNVSVRILIQDQNDNPPQVLYPVQTGGSMVAEMVPRSADVGYLNGEIRTVRQVSDKDAVKQRLSVIVEDNGQPSRSATVIVNVAVADSFPEVLSEFTDFAQDKEYNDNLTFYLVLALAVVSFLFITCLVVIVSVKIYRWRQSRILYHSSLPVIPYYPPRYSDTLGAGTLQHVYNYEVCRTTDSRKSDCKLGRAASQNVLIMEPSSTGTMQRIQSDKSILDEPDSPLEVG
ncbi:unnamed protein product, partial [Tetraodon nigroviridis]